MLVSGWPVPEYFYDKSLESRRDHADTRIMETITATARPTVKALRSATRTSPVITWDKGALNTRNWFAQYVNADGERISSQYCASEASLRSAIADGTLVWFD